MNNVFYNLAKYYLPGGNIFINNHLKGKSNMVMVNNVRNATKIINNYFSNALVGKPYFTIKRGKIVIHLFYYTKEGKRLNNTTINSLGRLLTTVIGLPVELRLVKLYYPYLNSYILAQYIAINLQDYTFTRVFQGLMGSISPVKDSKSLYTSNNNLPSYIMGIKIRVSGRLITERSRPRYTVQNGQVGSFAKNKMALVDTASYTTRNKKGAFTVKVWISQRVYGRNGIRTHKG